MAPAIADQRFSLLIDGVEIPAAFTTPPKPRLALLLIPGSLNSDVDGNFAPMFPGQPASTPHMYKDLAEQLGALGVAVLRFSKRGPGTGEVVRDKELARASYQQFGQRVRVADAFLGELRRRMPEAPITIAGHSEGSVVATLLAQRKPDLVSKLILLSGPAKPLLKLMIWQQFLNGAAGQAAYNEAMGWAEDYAAARPVPTDVAHNPLAGMLGFFSQPNYAVYLRSLEQVDPVEELAKTTQPVLIVQGGRDTSVLPANADLLLAARPDARVARLSELQHFYKPAAEGLSPMESFMLDGPSDAAVAATVADWAGGVAASSPA